MSAAPAFDRRVTPARPDLAAAHLQGLVAAPRYEAGLSRMVRAPQVPLRAAPHPEHGIDTELLRGALFTVYDADGEGWSWGQAEADGYVGWLPSEALGPPEPAQAKAVIVAALRSFVFPGPSIKHPPLGVLSFGARAAVRGEEGAFTRIAEGFLWSGHLRSADAVEGDPATVAERFLGTPYLWGGRTSLGLDCSGLVQLAFAACGRPAPRDSDMQERDLGTPLEADAPLRRGDLVFWRGHVGLMRDAATLLHANGHTMTVASEPLESARARILAAGGGPVTALRRP